MACSSGSKAHRKPVRLLPLQSPGSPVCWGLLIAGPGPKPKPATLGLVGLWEKSLNLGTV